MKNWRIYRLFHNKTLKRLVRLRYILKLPSYHMVHKKYYYHIMQGKSYSDFRLVMGIIILQLPIVVTLIVKAALFHARLEVTNLLQPEVSDLIVNFFLKQDILTLQVIIFTLTILSLILCRVYCIFHFHSAPLITRQFL